MLNRTELKEIALMKGTDNYFTSLYLNVDPMFNKNADYMGHLKNMIKESAETVDKEAYKRVRGDIDKIERHVNSNKRAFKKGLAIFSSAGSTYWREYNINVPVKNELIINKTPYIKPLMDLLDNYKPYTLVLV
ncbi:MAG: hypothetical protein L0Y62_05435, partial [Nitrospirae bacterium]|nr:hypothetical protein [Nitrospirota bacterium]